VKQDPTRTMDADRFRALALSYGATIARWPAAERREAEAFLAQSPESARWIDEQRQLDEQLDRVATEEPSPRLLKSVAEIPLRHAAATSTVTWWPFARLRSAIAIAAAAAAMGAAVGFVAPDHADVTDAQENWDDLSSLAFALDLSEELSP
jgi:hypothetical protein